MCDTTMTIVERLQQDGIRRLGTQRSGFRYVARNGTKLRGRERARVEDLRLPPAWSLVAIHPSPSARVQAVGRDAAGRWQYVYHPAHVRRREERKFARMVEFGRALPRLRRAVARDLREPGLGQRTVLACLVRILSTAFFRPGSEEYAQSNGSFGLATLRRKHVGVRGATVRFEFPGKAGKVQQRELRDARVARIVERLLELPGRQVFKFVAEDGTITEVRRSHINAYLKDVMGKRFSAKDFRTWAGTLMCACALANAGLAAGESQTARRRKLVAAIKQAAAHLGNTPAVCRASYVAPAVVAGFEQGRVIPAPAPTVDRLASCGTLALRRCERALLELLSAQPAERPARRAA
ncbi:MAG: DNA topoisomerase IB [Thermodesulfobacteriota bacterium]